MILPRPTIEVRGCKASYDSIRGQILSDWKIEGNKFTLRLTIPANTTARFFSRRPIPMRLRNQENRWLGQRESCFVNSKATKPSGKLVQENISKFPPPGHLTQPIATEKCVPPELHTPHFSVHFQSTSPEARPPQPPRLISEDETAYSWRR